MSSGAAWLLVIRGRLRRLLRLLAQEVEVDEPVAGRDEGRGRAAAPEPVHGHPRFPQPRRQPREVAVARDDHEALQVPRVEQVHRVDDQRGVGGVLAAGVGELLHRLDRVAQQLLLPAGEVRRGPVAVGALDVGVPYLAISASSSVVRLAVVLSESMRTASRVASVSGTRASLRT